MPEIEDVKTAKDSLGKVITPDTMELAGIYAELEFLLKDLKKIPPTASELQAMAVTVYIDRKRNSRGDTSSSGKTGSGYKKGSWGSGGGGGGKKPDPIECPECGRQVEPTFSEKKKVWYYKCAECNVFINKDGSTSKPR